MSEPVSSAQVEQLEANTGKRNWKRFVIRVAGSILVLSLLLYFLPRDKLARALDAFSVELWLAGVSTYLCLHLIGAAKWRMLINAAGGKLSVSQAVRCYYYGLFGNTFLPSVVGGDFIRAGLAMRLSASKGPILIGSIADRAIDSMGLALVAATGALLIPMSLDEKSRNIFWGFALVVSIALVLMLLVIVLLPVNKLPFKIRRMLVKARRSVSMLGRSWGKMVLALVAVLVLQVSQVLMSTWLGRLAKILNVGFLRWLFVWPVAKLSAMAPLTQGGIGVREAVQGTLFLPFGVSMEKAVATGLMFQAIVIAGNLFGGVVAWVMGRVSSLPLSQNGDRKKAQRILFGTTIALAITLFFVANTLMLALGTGAIDDSWLHWMAWLPGYSVSFAGSVIGLLYGALLGLIIGLATNRFIRKGTAKRKPTRQ